MKSKGHMGSTLESDIWDVAMCFVTMPTMNNSDRLVNKQAGYMACMSPGGVNMLQQLSFQQ